LIEAREASLELSKADSLQRSDIIKVNCGGGCRMYVYITFEAKDVAGGESKIYQTMVRISFGGRNDKLEKGRTRN